MLFQKEHSGVAWYIAKTLNPAVTEPTTVIPTKGPDIEKKVSDIAPIPFASVGIIYENGTTVGKQSLVASIKLEGTIPLLTRNSVERELTIGDREKID